MKVLLTGGCGNLGSWLTEYLVGHQYHVTVLTRTKRSYFLDRGIETLVVDITDLSGLKDRLADRHFDYFIHLASANDPQVEDYSRQALQVNAGGTRNLLEIVINKPIKNFIYFSTFHVYGTLEGTITEETSVQPLNDYAVTHLFAESYIQQFHRTHGLPYTILRLTNSYGAPKNRDSSKWYLLLNDLSKMAFTEQRIVLRNNGTIRRDFIWMGDVCEVVLKIMQRGKALNGIFNLSAERTYPLKEIAHYVQEAYEEVYGRRLEIRLDRQDPGDFGKEFFVSSRKLKSFIPLCPHHRFKEEAKAIFELLSNA